MKEKQGKRKSEENGNGAGGRAMSTGVKGEEENRKTVIMLQSSVSCVPRAGSPDWSVREPGIRLHRGLSFWKETVVNQRILL